jgi:hypothetical protein
MAEPDNFDTRERPHIPIDAFRETAAYTFPSRAQERKPLREDYAAHAAQILEQLAGGRSPRLRPIRASQSSV